MSGKVKLLEIWINVEALGAEVICTRYVRDDALSFLADQVCSHPHVPIPLLEKPITIHENLCPICRN